MGRGGGAGAFYHSFIVIRLFRRQLTTVCRYCLFLSFLTYSQMKTTTVGKIGGTYARAVT